MEEDTTSAAESIVIDTMSKNDDSLNIYEFVRYYGGACYNSSCV